MNKKLPGLWTFFLTRFRVTLLFSILFFVMGVFSYQNMPQENTPDVEIPLVIISTFWPGATAQDMENLVTEKIETEVKNVEDIKEYSSISLPGYSSVLVEFEMGTDMTENTNKVEDAVDDAKRNLPDSLPDDPDVEQANISNTPILTLSLSGDYSYSQLKIFAESLSDELETLDGVKEARLSGVPDEQYHFYVDPIKLQGLGLSLDEVLSKINAAHRDIPLGAVTVRGESVDIRVEGEIESVEDFMMLPIQSQNGQTIKLEDIGEVRREFDELTIEKFISTGKPSARLVAIDILKAKTKTNIPKTVDNALATVQEYKENGLLPQNLEVSVVFNSAEEIEKSLGDLFDSGFQTLIVIGIVLLLALGWRESLLAFIAVPLTLLMAIMGLSLIGETFNFLSLFALVLALGLLVDNAIIMTEGISEGIYNKKLSPVEAAKDALVQFRWPVITGTATTMLAFAPMLFMISGVSGEFIEGIPKTVILVLLASLFVSLFVLPAFGVMFFQLFPPQSHRDSKIMTEGKNLYVRFMNFVLLKKKRVYSLIAVSVGVMIFSFWLPASGKVSVEIFPPSDENFFTLSVEGPVGTDLSTMKTFVSKLDEAFLPYFEDKEKWLKNYQISVGEKSPFDPNNDSGSGGNTENIIGITVNLFNKSERSISSLEITPRVKKDLEKILPEYLEIKVSEVQSGPPGGDQPITVKIASEDSARLDILASKLTSLFEEMELESGATLKNITDDQGDRVPQMVWKFDREKLDRYNLSPAQLQQTLRAGVQGVTALQLSEGTEEVDVDVRFDFEGTRVWKNPESLDILSRIPIKTPTGDFIRLSDVATFTITSKKTRFKHLSGRQTISVGAGIEGDATAAQFSKKLEAAIATLPTQPGDSVSIGGDNEESSRLVSEMAMAMLLAVFLILAILILQFDSFLQAGVIITLLPLSLTGVFLGFWVSGTPISFPTMIGIVALAGIIVNDAIVLIDQINTNNKLEPDKIKSFIESGTSRMQPIILTSVTTIFGLLPLALSDPLWQGLGFAIIYGMILATFLTIVLVPCLIILFEDISRGIGWLIMWPIKRLRK